jgi:hypothetical protein
MLPRVCARRQRTPGTGRVREAPHPTRPRGFEPLSPRNRRRGEFERRTAGRRDVDRVASKAGATGAAGGDANGRVERYRLTRGRERLLGGGSGLVVGKGRGRRSVVRHAVVMAAVVSRGRENLGSRRGRFVDSRQLREVGPPPTLGARLRRARRRRFVGRAGELELFRAAVEGPGAPWSVLFVYGPGGVGWQKRDACGLVISSSCTPRAARSATPPATADASSARRR